MTIEQRITMESEKQLTDLLNDYENGYSTADATINALFIAGVKSMERFLAYATKRQEAGIV